MNCSNCKFARKPVLKDAGYIGCQKASRREDVEEALISMKRKAGDHYMFWSCKLNQDKKGVMKVGVCVYPDAKCFEWEEIK